MIMAFRPNGIVVNGVLLRSDTASGNLNFYKGMEGFLESFPQAIYQISILLRSARQIGTKYNQIIHFILKNSNSKRFVTKCFSLNFRRYPDLFHLHVIVYIKHDIIVFLVPPAPAIHHLR